MFDYYRTGHQPKSKSHKYNTNDLIVYSWDYKLQSLHILYKVMREEVELFEWPSYEWE